MGCLTSTATHALPLDFLQTMMSTLENVAGEVSGSAWTVASWNCDLVQPFSVF